MVMSNDDWVDPFYHSVRLRLAACKAFLASYPAAPEAAPKATAFPPGNNAANGKMSPFWRLFLLGTARRFTLLGLMLEMICHTSEVGNLCSCGVMGQWWNFPSYCFANRSDVGGVRSVMVSSIVYNLMRNPSNSSNGKPRT